MLNLSIFLKDNPDADYHRQQVGERGIMDIIDNLNGIVSGDLVEFYRLLNQAETSLLNCANDPHTRRALESFATPEPVAEEPEPVAEEPEPIVEETEQETEQETGQESEQESEQESGQETEQGSEQESEQESEQGSEQESEQETKE